MTFYEGLALLILPLATLMFAIGLAWGLVFTPADNARLSRDVSQAVGHG